MSSQPGRCARREPRRCPAGGARQSAHPAERAAAISLFDARFGQMEQVLWFLSARSRSGLLAGESSPELEALVWTVKSWWGVQGVRSEAKAQMATALAGSVTWTPGLFGPAPGYGPDRAEFALAAPAGRQVNRV
jgi:hypothetical protein